MPVSQDATRAALLVIAASDVSAAEPLLDAMAELGLEPGTLDVAESAGLLRTDVATIGFRHPLMRSLVYRQSSGASRRAAHAALAAVAGRRDEPEREAWHRAAALVKLIRNARVGVVVDSRRNARVGRACGSGSGRPLGPDDGTDDGAAAGGHEDERDPVQARR